MLSCLRSMNRLKVRIKRECTGSKQMNIWPEFFGFPFPVSREFAKPIAIDPLQSFSVSLLR